MMVFALPNAGCDPYFHHPQLRSELGGTLGMAQAKREPPGEKRQAAAPRQGRLIHFVRIFSG
jgi:hypothetical protein